MMDRLLSIGWLRQSRPLYRTPRCLAVAVAAAALLLSALVTVPTSGAQDMISELQAEFIGRFPQFIEWPAGSSVSEASTPFVIGVLGDSQVFLALERLATRTRIKGKKVETRRLTNVSDVDACHIVFVSASRRSQLSDVLVRTSGKPILTVSDSEGFGRRGVMINFTLEGESLRFEINASAASANGLNMAPKLLALGKVL